MSSGRMRIRKKYSASTELSVRFLCPVEILFSIIECSESRHMRAFCGIFTALVAIIYTLTCSKSQASL